MVMERLNQPDTVKGAILDGFPRTLGQAEALDKALAARGQQISVVLLIAVPDDVVVERLSGRLICRECQATFHRKYNPFESCPYNKCEGEYLYQREDDKPETVRSRLEVYKEQTSPLVDYYRDQGVLAKVDGDQPMKDVEADLIAAVPDA
jgi:adenylate kinase